MVLVDTSLWVATVRRNAAATDRQQVQALLRNSEAVWCSAVRLELWIGIGGEAERRHLKNLMALVRDLPISEAVWEKAIELADIGRRCGWTFPFADLLIFACAKVHGVELIHRDRHFDQMATL